MDTIACMQLFARSVQLGSFSAAARQAGIAPASVFRAVNALEDSIGAKLLNRTSRRLSLTEAGALYYERLQSILSAMDDLKADIGQLQATPKGTLRVLSRVAFGNKHLAPVLPEFLLRHGSLRVELILSDHPTDLVAEKIDVAILWGDVTSPSLVRRKLVSSPRTVCASPRYLDKYGRPQRPADVAAHNCLTFRSDVPRPAWRFIKDGELTEIAVSGSLRSDGSEVLREGALRHLGIVLLPTWMVGPDLAAGRLVPLLADYQASAFGFDDDVCIVTHKARHRSLKVQLFIEFCLQHFRARTNWASLTND
ncbi:hypothetical protein CAL12_20695 [Bordetella genomosp. 8]|uniref:HTH lysR-type domain-containing protein n=2 Tax=Bordetella genomosp. 8 TaxID=1416806 RepID=A0A1W6YPI0_9BORD|nr:hypothetical protein CAL12_20695 [Bordetella genomosp. 8]